MPDIDERLQYYLSQIEAGVPKEKVLASLKEGEQELAALIKLADAMRTISHPMPSPTYMRAAKQKILTVAPQARSKTRVNKGFQPGWLFLPSLTGVVAIFLVLFITLATLGVWLAGPARAEVARIQNIEGLVELADNSAAAEWFLLENGDPVRSGQQIRTSSGSSATLVYSDGSQTHLYPETTILLKKVDGTWGGDLQVELEQTIGKTYHKVVPLHSQAAFFKIRTPAGIASVQGTSFTVDVQSNGVARVIVNSGEVAVASATDKVLLTAGKAILLQTGKPPQEAGNFFSIVDFVVAMRGKEWAVSGQKFFINDVTYISGAPQIGQALQIEGRILPTGEWVADRISPVETTVRSTFTGVIESIAQGKMWVGGKNITISEITHLDPNLVVGDQVEVIYLALNDQQWLAVSVDKLGETSAESEALPPTATLNDTAVPTPVSEEAMAACLSAGPSVEVLNLAVALNAALDEVLTLSCSGLTLEEIELAYNLSAAFNWTVTEIAQLRLSGMSWDEIGAYLLQNLPPSQTAGSPECVGVVMEPRIQQLANKYGVTYDEIAELICSGYSIGSIELAYKLASEAEESGYDPQAILEMKANGMSWGQIKQALKDSASPQDDKEHGPPDKEPKPTKDPKNPKSEEDSPAAKTPPGLEDKNK